ncbi:MAG: hypothetical protein ACI9TH_004333, partial [Kiritimatiellia bacterium]
MAEFPLDLEDTMKRLNMHVLNQRVRGASLFALFLTAGNL